MHKKTKNTQPVKTKQSRFSKAHFIVFALVFAAVGGYIVVKSFAATPGATTCDFTYGPSQASTIQSTVSLSANAGKTVCISAGTFTSALTLSGTHATDITIQTDPAADPNGAGKVTIPGINIGNNASHIVVKGFYSTRGIDLGAGSNFITIDHNDVTNSSGFGISIATNITSDPDGHDLTISGNKIHDTSHTSEGDALRLQGWYNVTITANEIYNVYENQQACNPTGNNDLCHTDCLQSYQANVNRAHDLVYDHNYLHDNNCQAFFLKDGDVATNVTVTNNLWVRNNNPLGISGWHSFWVDENTVNMIVRGNTILDNGDSALSSEGSTPNPTLAFDHNVFNAINYSDQTHKGYAITNDYNVYTSNNQFNWPAKAAHEQYGTSGISYQCGSSCGNGTQAGDDYRLVTQPYAGNTLGINWKPADYTYGPQTTVATGQTANLWVSPAGSASCTRSSSPVAYSSSGTNVCTWQRAYNQASAGDTVLVKGGDYSALTVKLRQNTGKAVTFQSADNEKPIFDGFDNGDYQDPGVSNITIKGPMKSRTFRADGTTGVTVDGWEADCSTCTTAGQAQMFHGEDTTNFTVKNSSIHDSHAINPSGGMTYVSGTNLVFDNDEFYNAAVNDDQVHSECMYVAGLSGDPGITIKRSRFYHCSYEDVFFGGSQYVVNGTIENSIFERDWNGYPTGSVRNIQAIKFRDSTSDPLTPDIGNIKLSYNTFRGVLHFGTQTGSYPNAYVGPLVAEGNIILSGATNCFASTTAIWRYNAFLSGACTGTNNVTNAGLLSTTNFTDVTSDPGDWHLKSSAAALIDKGNPSSFPSVDKDGHTRTGTPDIGAYEYASGTPTPKQGDLNGDNVVNIFDLSILLSHYGQTGQTSSNGDLNSDAVVNIFDLSILLSKYGT